MNGEQVVFWSGVAAFAVWTGLLAAGKASFVRVLCWTATLALAVGGATYVGAVPVEVARTVASIERVVLLVGGIYVVTTHLRDHPQVPR